MRKLSCNKQWKTIERVRYDPPTKKNNKTHVYVKATRFLGRWKTETNYLYLLPSDCGYYSAEGWWP